MSKTISQLTVSDFPYIYKLNDSIRLVSNVSGLGARYFHSNRTGGHIYLDSGIPTNYNEYFTGYSSDWDADNNDSPLKFPTSFMDYTGKIPRNDIDTNVLNVGSAWFSNYGQKMVWVYFVVDDTPKNLEHINPSLKADNVTVSITGNTVTLTANSGYKIKDATLDIGNSLFGDSTPLKFNVASDGLSASVTVTDKSLIDPSQEYNLTVHTKQITDLEHINPSLKADNVTVSITGNTVNLTANSGYKITSATLDIGNSLFGDDTPLKFNVASDGLTASVTVTDDSLIDSNQEYNLTVHTETTKPYTLQDVDLQCNDENVALSVSNNTATLTAKSGYKITSATITSKNKVDFSGSTRQDHNFTISADGSSATITLTPDKNLDYTLNVSSAEKPQQPSEPTPPTETPTQPTPPAETQTKYTVNINQIKDYVTYSTNGLVITLTTKDKILINSIHAAAELTVLGETYKLDDSTISIAADKKSAAITVPTNYNGSGYEITITGDFSNQTPTPTNPTGTNSIHIYQLDDDTLTKFSTDAIQYYQGGNNQTGYDFQKFITQLYKLPFAIPNTESEGTTNILTGWYTINRPARKIKNTHYILNLGTIKVVNVNKNGFDHNVASCTLYLPYVSPIKVPYETILNHNLNVKYDTDLLAGKTTVNIFVDDKLLTSLQTNINENLDLYNIYNDSINGTLSSILNNTLDHCYIKVEYYKPIENLVSYETNEHGTLKDYKGYLQTKNTIVSCGTNEEQQAITQLLEQGVIIK